MHLLGLNIVQTPMAREVRTEFKVTRCGSRWKKRKRYYVRRIDIDRPGCYQAGGTLYMHPTLYAAMRDQVAARQQEGG